MTGLSAIKYIYKLLSEYSDLKEIVQDKIYPDIAENTTTFPFIIMQRQNIETEGSKYQTTDDNVNIGIAVASTTYNEAVNIAEIIRKILDNYHDKIIKECTMINATEYFTENTYIQELTFQINM